MAATKNSPKGGHHPAGEDTFGTRKLHGPALITLAGVGTEVFIEFIGYIHKVVGIGRCRLLPRDVGPNRRVLAVEVEPLFKSRFRIRLDSVNRAFRLANTAIDAFVRVDDEHVLTLVEAIHRAYLHAVRVLAANAALVDDVGHVSLLSGRPINGSAASGESMSRVTCVAASVQTANIHDRDLGPLSLDL